MVNALPEIFQLVDASGGGARGGCLVGGRASGGCLDGGRARGGCLDGGRATGRCLPEVELVVDACRR